MLAVLRRLHLGDQRANCYPHSTTYTDQLDKTPNVATPGSCVGVGVFCH
jgi:hypothetical protein